MRSFEGLQYSLPRLDGHHLYFRSAVHGIHVVTTSFLIVLAFAFFVESASGWKWVNCIFQSTSIDFDYSANWKVLLAASLVLAPYIGHFEGFILNFRYDERKSFEIAAKLDELEWTILDAAAKRRLIMAALEDGKIYVGFVLGNANPDLGERRYLHLLPVMSGYRNQVGKVDFTTFYDEIYSEDSSDDQRLNPEDFVVVLPISRLITVRQFDPAAYAKFQGNENN